MLLVPVRMREEGGGGNGDRHGNTAQVQILCSVFLSQVELRTVTVDVGASIEAVQGEKVFEP